MGKGSEAARARHPVEDPAIPGGEAVLRTKEGPQGQPGLRALYRSRQERLVCTSRGKALHAITFQWPDRELALPIPEPPSGVRVRLLGREGELPWRYDQGTLFVDVSEVPYREIPGQWAWTFELEGYIKGFRDRTGVAIAAAAAFLLTPLPIGAQVDEAGYVPETDPLVLEKLERWPDLKLGLLMH